MKRGSLSVFIVVALVGCGGDDSSPPDTDAALSSAKDITSFSFLAADNPALVADAVGTISGDDIAVSSRFALTVAGLKATFTTTGATVTVAGQPQTSGVTPNTFSASNPVIYTVTAEDGSSHAYVVHVAAPSFRPKVDFPTGVSVASVSTGDFNGDGKPDLAVTNQTPPTVSVLLDTTATGATTPTFVKTDFATGPSPGYLAIGDLNGDGKLDVAAASTSPGSVAVFINTTAAGATTPTFAARRDFTTGALSIGVVIADVNTDGKPDLTVMNGGSPSSASVFLNTTPAGSSVAVFAAKVDFTLATSASSIAAGDVNGDGKPDLVVAHVGLLRPVLALINTTATGAATPTFAANHEILSGENSQAVSLVDINADTKLDLVVSDANPVGALVYLNTTGAGATPPTFAAPLLAETGGAPSGFAFGDIDGDGKVDMAAAASTSTLALLLGTTAAAAATPSFRVKREYATASIGNSVAIGDFNGDSKPDVAVANSTAGSVSVLLAE